MATLGAPLAAPLGGSAGIIAIPGAPYEYVSTHASQAVSDLIAILNKERTAALLRESVYPLQRLELAIWNLMAKMWDIDNAGGAMLARIGRLVDLAKRDGWDDATYRRRIRARIYQLLSNGRIPEIITITLLVLGTVEDVVHIREHIGPACMDLYLLTEPTETDVEDLCVALGAAKGGGVSLQLVVAQDVTDYVETLISGDEGGAVVGGVWGDEGGAVTGEGPFPSVQPT